MREPSVRRPDLDIPPELDRICVRATALDPVDRYPSVRSLNEDLERFLEGDRDLALRKEIAAHHLDAARQALGGATREEAYAARARAIRELSSALAFDPKNPAAVAQLVKTLGESLEDLPPPALADYEEALKRTRQSTSRQTAIAYLSGFALYAYFFFVGVRSLAAFLFASVSMALVAVYSATWSVRSPWTVPHQLTAFALAVIAVCGTASFFGPLVLMPTFAAVSALVFFAQVRVERRVQYLCILLMGAGMTVPLVLQALGVLPATYELRDGLLIIRPWITREFNQSSLVLLWLASLQLMAIPCLLVGRAVELLVNAERRLFAHAWNLRNLVPGGAA